MADNIAVTPGAGAIVATDDVGGVQYQIIKVDLGGDGVSSPLIRGAQSRANSLPTTLSTEDQAAQGALTETAPASDTASSGLNGRLQRIAQRITSLIALLPTALGQGTMAQSLKVVLPSDQSTLPINQVSQGYDVAVSLTRPANTTAYTAGDVIGAAAAALTFASAGPNAGCVMITGVQLEADIAAIPSGQGTFRLALYSVTPPSALADNAAFDLPSGDRASFLGLIDLPALIDLGSTLYAETGQLNKQIRLSGTSVFAYLITNGAFTPGAVSEVYKVTLHTIAV